MTIAKLPLVQEIANFDFAATPINEALVRELATGSFLQSRRNAVLVGGTGKTHLAIALGRACVRGGARVRFYNARKTPRGRDPRRAEAIARGDRFAADCFHHHRGHDLRRRSPPAEKSHHNTEYN